MKTFTCDLALKRERLSKNGEQKRTENAQKMQKNTPSKDPKSGRNGQKPKAKIGQKNVQKTDEKSGKNWEKTLKKSDKK